MARQLKQLCLFSQDTLDEMIRGSCIHTNNVTKHVYEIFGEEYQNAMVYEELGELTQSISKYTRNKIKGNSLNTSLDNMAEEIADVKIVLEELTHYHKLENKVKEKYEFKLQRLTERVRERLLNNYIGY